jgi:ABC-type microcin C transport system permease subunit YejB
MYKAVYSLITRDYLWRVCLIYLYILVGVNVCLVTDIAAVIV